MSSSRPPRGKRVGARTGRVPTAPGAKPTSPAGGNATSTNPRRPVYQKKKSNVTEKLFEGAKPAKTTGATSSRPNSTTPKPPGRKAPPAAPSSAPSANQRKRSNGSVILHHLEAQQGEAPKPRPPAPAARAPAPSSASNQVHYPSLPTSLRSEEVLRQFLGTFGKILSVDMNYVGRGALVTFANAKSAQNAMKGAIMPNGRPLIGTTPVNIAPAPSQRGRNFENAKSAAPSATLGRHNLDDDDLETMQRSAPKARTHTRNDDDDEALPPWKRANANTFADWDSDGDQEGDSGSHNVQNNDYDDEQGDYDDDDNNEEEEDEHNEDEDEQDDNNDDYDEEEVDNQDALDDAYVEPANKSLRRWENVRPKNESHHQLPFGTNPNSMDVDSTYASEYDDGEVAQRAFTSPTRSKMMFLDPSNASIGTKSTASNLATAGRAFSVGKPSALSAKKAQQLKSQNLEESEAEGAENDEKGYEDDNNTYTDAENGEEGEEENENENAASNDFESSSRGSHGENNANNGYSDYNDEGEMDTDDNTDENGEPAFDEYLGAISEGENLDDINEDNEEEEEEEVYQPPKTSKKPLPPPPQRTQNLAKNPGPRPLATESLGQVLNPQSNPGKLEACFFMPKHHWHALEHTDEKRAVGSFQRPAGGDDIPPPEHVRTVSWLYKSLIQAERNATDAERARTPRIEIYDYLLNRFRQILKELTQQSTMCYLSCYISESIARRALRMRAEILLDVSPLDLANFDTGRTKVLDNAYEMCKNIYTFYTQTGRTAPFSNEILAYYLMFRLRDGLQPSWPTLLDSLASVYTKPGSRRSDQGEMRLFLNSLRYESNFDFVVKVCDIYASNHWSALRELAQSATFLQLCSLADLMPDIVYYAVSQVMATLKDMPLPASYLQYNFFLRHDSFVPPMIEKFFQNTPPITKKSALCIDPNSKQDVFYPLFSASTGAEEIVSPRRGLKSSKKLNLMEPHLPVDRTVWREESEEICKLISSYPPTFLYSANAEAPIDLETAMLVYKRWLDSDLSVDSTLPASGDESENEQNFDAAMASLDDESLSIGSKINEKAYIIPKGNVFSVSPLYQHALDIHFENANFGSSSNSSSSLMSTSATKKIGPFNSAANGPAKTALTPKIGFPAPPKLSLPKSIPKAPSANSNAHPTISSTTSSAQDSKTKTENPSNAKPTTAANPTESATNTSTTAPKSLFAAKPTVASQTIPGTGGINAKPGNVKIFLKPKASAASPLLSATTTSLDTSSTQKKPESSGSTAISASKVNEQGSATQEQIKYFTEAMARQEALTQSLLQTQAQLMTQIDSMKETEIELFKYAQRSKYADQSATPSTASKNHVTTLGSRINFKHEMAPIQIPSVVAPLLALCNSKALESQEQRHPMVLTFKILVNLSDELEPASGTTENWLKSQLSYAMECDKNEVDKNTPHLRTLTCAKYRVDPRIDNPYNTEEVKKWIENCENSTQSAWLSHPPLVSAIIKSISTLNISNDELESTNAALKGNQGVLFYLPDLSANAQGAASVDAYWAHQLERLRRTLHFVSPAHPVPLLILYGPNNEFEEKIISERLALHSLQSSCSHTLIQKLISNDVPDAGSLAQLLRASSQLEYFLQSFASLTKPVPAASLQTVAISNLLKVPLNDIIQQNFSQYRNSLLENKEKLKLVEQENLIPSDLRCPGPSSFIDQWNRLLGATSAIVSDPSLSSFDWPAPETIEIFPFVRSSYQWPSANWNESSTFERHTHLLLSFLIDDDSKFDVTENDKKERKGGNISRNSDEFKGKSTDFTKLSSFNSEDVEAFIAKLISSHPRLEGFGEHAKYALNRYHEQVTKAQNIARKTSFCPVSIPFAWHSLFELLFAFLVEQLSEELVCIHKDVAPTQEALKEVRNLRRERQQVESDTWVSWYQSLCTPLEQIRRRAMDSRSAADDAQWTNALLSQFSPPSSQTTTARLNHSGLFASPSPSILRSPTPVRTGPNSAASATPLPFFLPPSSSPSPRAPATPSAQAPSYSPPFSPLLAVDPLLARLQKLQERILVKQPGIEEDSVPLQTRQANPKRKATSDTYTIDPPYSKRKLD